MVVIGVLLLGAIRLIPVVGTIVWGLASIFGVGVALATKFGRREPWFLEFRAAERVVVWSADGNACRSSIA